MRVLWLFLLLPIIEIALFVVIGGEIGVWATLAWVVLSAIAGMALIRFQGQQAALDLQQSLQELRNPSQPMAQRSFKMLAGMLLILPGFFTDALGLLLLLPPVRSLILRQIAARVKTSSVGFGYSGGFPGAQRPGGSNGVIDGEYVVQDDPYIPQSSGQIGPGDSSQKPGNSGWTRH
ncbi:FxsA family protein [Paracoccus aminophilus]|uniref:Membrane protein n=1 Tax=Paracoccus aminophilus JCM 7686 TaxID=1367847 RepID=S5XSP4_PARAH|nr:FxsA family protein [Paracoccus aminophilus]AGT10464.1 membrane protein [Paracoccus aminophilus JCM 7686]